MYKDNATNILYFHLSNHQNHGSDFYDISVKQHCFNGRIKDLITHISSMNFQTRVGLDHSYKQHEFLERADL